MRVINARPTQVMRRNNIKLMEYWKNEKEPFYMAVSVNDYMDRTELKATNRRKAINEFIKDIIGE